MRALPNNNAQHAVEQTLAEDLGGFFNDPLGFVRYAYHWGHGDLAGHDGPDTWQADVLGEIGKACSRATAKPAAASTPYSCSSGSDTSYGKATLKPAAAASGSEPWSDEGARRRVPRRSMDATEERAEDATEERAEDATEERTKNHSVRLAVTSGHGIGKSALVSWIIHWAMSTRPHLAGVVTANTGRQLSDKTWRELSLWHKRLINRHWFKWTATKFYQTDNAETWFVSSVPWSKENPEAFAGLHAEHVLMLFDEASAIDDVIWDTAEGALTTPGAIWCAFGNPTRNSGKFHACFHRFKHRWITRQIDSRTAKMTNKPQLEQWVEDYGEDSDFVRIRVRGVFPGAGNCQLIPSDAVDAAMSRLAAPDQWRHAPKILGVDVARFGDDQSVIALRQGLALVRPLWKYRGLDTMTLAGLVAGLIDKERVDMCFVDVGGVGAGVVDRLHQLGFRDRVIGVDFGGKAAESALYVNKRTEMWCLLRDWMPQAVLPADEELRTDLTAPEYSFTGDKGQIALERKKDMKARGLASPDCADALALTFAMPVMPRSGKALVAKTDYNVAAYGL